MHSFTFGIVVTRTDKGAYYYLSRKTAIILILHWDTGSLFFILMVVYIFYLVEIVHGFLHDNCWHIAHVIMSCFPPIPDIL